MSDLLKDEGSKTPQVMGDTRGILGSCLGLHCVSRVLPDEQGKKALPRSQGAILDSFLQVSHVQPLKVYCPVEK